MSFIWPAALPVLLLAPLLAWAYLSVLRRRARLSVAYPAISELAKVAAAGAPWRRHVPAAIFLAGVGAMTLALARPVWPVPVPDNQTSVMIVLDVSGSMNWDDVKPRRIEAAKLAATHFVNELPVGVKVGLVKFSSTASLMIPPIENHDAVVAAIQTLEPELATAIGDGLLEGVYALPGREAYDPRKNGGSLATSISVSAVDASRLPPAAIVLMSDGGNNMGSSPMDAVVIAHRLNVRVYTVGLGTTGTEGIMDLDEDTLKKMAAAAQGTYHRASSARELSKVWKQLGRSVAWRTKPVEVSGLVSEAATFFLGAAVVLSMAWNRLY